jgi:O-antigen/teichoic acid export membrane protein
LHKASSSGAALWMVSAAVIVAGLNYGLNIVLGWLLPVEVYGQIGISQTLLFIGVWFLGAGFPWVVTRAVAQARGHEPSDGGVGAQAWRTYKTAWLASSLLTLLLVALFWLAYSRHWLPLEATYAPLVVLVAVTVAALGIGSVPNAGLQGLFRFGIVGMLRLVEAVINIVASLVLVALGFGATGALAGFALSGLVALGANVWFIRDKPFWRAPDWGGLSTIRAAFPMTLAGFGGVLLTNVDVLAIKFLSPPASSDALSGTYQVAAVLARAPLFVGIALIGAFYPRIAEPGHASPNEQVAVRELLQWVATTVLPMSTLMAVGAPAVVAFFFPERYASAAPTLTVLALGGASVAWATGLASIHQARGRTRAPALIMTGAVLAQMVGLVWLVPRYGMPGAAIASALASTLACCLFVVAGRDFALVPPNARRHALALLVLAALALPLGTLLAHAPRPQILAWGVVAGAGYLVSCFLLNVISARALRALLPSHSGMGGAIPRTAVRIASMLNAAGFQL